LWRQRHHHQCRKNQAHRQQDDDTKEYIRHTGYPGGQRIRTFRKADTAHQKPQVIVEQAIKGMLPKNTPRTRTLPQPVMFMYRITEHKHRSPAHLQQSRLNLNQVASMDVSNYLRQKKNRCRPRVS
jgi:ribosomal protein L13